MADLPLPCSYDIHPSLKTYDITADSYLSQRAEYAGIICATIIIHKGRVLLLQRALDDDYPNLWEVPGGEVKSAETLVQCAVRELKEETGLANSVVTISDSNGDLEIKLDPQKHQGYL